MAKDRLSASKVARLQRRGRYCDGGGLWLQVSKWHTKSWIFQFAANGRVRQFGLGSLQTVSLAEAREKALACRKQLLAGLDPIEAARGERDRQRLAQASRVTFTTCAENYITAHQAGWKSAKHREQW